MKHFLEGKYFYRLIDDEKNGGCISQHGKIIAVDAHFALVKFGSWIDGTPIDKVVEYGGRLLTLMELCDEYCCFFDSFEEVIVAEADMSSDEHDEFASKWEAKMSEQE